MDITPETTKQSIAYPSFAKMAAVAAFAVSSFAVCPAEEEQEMQRTEGAVPYDEVEQIPQRQSTPKPEPSPDAKQEEQRTGGYLPEGEVRESPRRRPAAVVEPVDEPITEPEAGAE